MLDILYFYRAQVIFFAVFMAAVIPMMYYYQRRSPNPRFRPKVGEMLLVGLLAVFACGALAFGLGGVFNPNNDWRKMREKPRAEPVAWDGGGATQQQPAAEKKPKTPQEILKGGGQ